MSRCVNIAVLALIVTWLNYGDGARILGIFPTPSISHQVVFRTLTLELNKRGHELVIVTTDPVNDKSIKNYKEIDISYLYEHMRADVGNIISHRGHMNWYMQLRFYEPMMWTQMVRVFNHPEFKDVYEPNSGEKFDLILMEIFFTPGFMALAERFDAPIIGIASASLQLNVQYGIGNPILPSHPSIWEMEIKSRDSWIPWERLENFYQSWRLIYHYRTVSLPKQKEIAEKYLGIKVSDLHDLEKNISLIFVNQQGPISFVRPNVPNVIEIGGFHVSDKIKPLPKNLQKTLDEATQGFIYMSLGSNVKSNMLSEKARNAFITAFSKLPHKVIWKFEDDQLEGKPDNVIILKWAPQQAILAHPNIKLFIYQGGLQSTEEAVSHGVPLIGIPVMGDQDTNVNKMVSLGVAQKLDIFDINVDNLLEAIRTVTLDNNYKQRMLNLGSLLKDKPQNSLQNAIWWTEHVIRHRGALHLHSATAEEPWYQRQDMDIIAFLSAAFVFTLLLTNLIFYKCAIYSIRAFGFRSVDKKKKRTRGMSRCVNIAVLALIVTWLNYGDGARILGIFPTPSISHQVVFRTLCLELNKRGHELVIVTTDPVNDKSIKNYKEIDISYLYEQMRADVGNIISHRGHMNWYMQLRFYEPMMWTQMVRVFNHPEFKDVYEPNSGEKFDLILMEIFFTPGFMALAERFDAPIIGIASASLQLTVQYGIGNPILPSHPSTWEMDVKLRDSWIPWQRLENFYQTWKNIYHYRTVSLPKQKEIVEEYLGIEVSDLHDLEKNISLIFVNQQGPISFVRPNVPNVIEIGGFHVSDKIKPLPKDLQKTLDEATQGFIYMSLGSNVKSRMLSEKERNAFITAFSKLPHKVIWKFEDDQLEGKPDNVIILKWAPQQAILAHPNIKLFIYQGGLQSTEEAVSHGVPLIGIPVMGDQDMNVNKMVSLGVAQKLDIFDINVDDLLEAIRTVTLDNNYKQRMLNLGSLLKDKPQDSLQNAIWWTEHVIRHRGALHLHSVTAEEPWYQRQDMDIIAFLSATFVCTLLLTNLMVYKCAIYSIRTFGFLSVDKKKKRISRVRDSICTRTMSRWLTIVVLALIGGWLNCGDGARILGIFPAPSISHQVVFRTLCLELNKRGHELVIVTTDPVNDKSIKNYKEIDISFLYEDKTNDFVNIINFRGHINWNMQLKIYEPFVWAEMVRIFNHPEFKKVYEPNSGEKFDLILMEIFFTPGFMALAERFDAPIIGIASASLQLTVQYGIGNPILPSHPSTWEMDVKLRDSWIPWQRLENFYQTWRNIYHYRTVSLPKQKEIAEEYLGIEVSDLHDLEKNISLIFVNQQGPISFVRPNVPNVIEIGGFHVSDKIKPLPKDLQKTLDEATQGFIYMSLGSNVKSRMLSEKERNAFITAFSKLPYKVIWKFEDDQLEGKPDNVIILKWAPQQSILAHPNIKLFIYQGGLQSTEEAVSHGVPLIGIPVMGDQDMNVNKMVSLGVAQKLDIFDINVDNLLEAIRTVTLDNNYKQRMLNLGSLLKDKPQNSLQNAIWWTEHVIRHKGVPHLHSATADNPWYQRQDMDIIAFLTVVFVCISMLAILILYMCAIRVIRTVFSNSPIDKKKKRS
ncbi:uncharacterized protein LOC124414214 [Diprion similis]|uniref:uncharacterized protein LOC124414214 n=1 Tax=Diprion similis TaxID=362088 RepID=UPI001EF8DE8F|nr:uncharacterized protein LOC124414214 [Diprion similis]